MNNTQNSKIIKENIEKLKVLIEKSEKILLINHVNMDADAFWSLMWFYNILEKIYSKNVKATNVSNSPERLKFLWYDKIIDPNLDIKEFEPDLIISFDAADEKRLWEKYEDNKEIFEKASFVVIDHHISNIWFWDINIINTKSSSTCEIIFDILKSWKYDYLIDSDTATLLLTGIITDTNSFYNSNIKPKTFEISSRLLDLWARHQEIIINLFKKNPFSRIKLWWKILENLKQADNWNIAWWVCPREYFLETGTTYEDLDVFIDEFLATIDKAKVVFILYDMWKEWIKSSFRSLEMKYNVAEFAWIFWWWWHPQAAWFSVKDKWIYDLESEIILALKNFFNYSEKKKLK